MRETVAPFLALFTNSLKRFLLVLYDQSILLNNYYTSNYYPIKMRRIKFKDVQTGKVFIFLTNNFELKATDIAQLYKNRWKIKLFFKWI